jgi:hypothetical protein
MGFVRELADPSGSREDKLTELSVVHLRSTLRGSAVHRQESTYYSDYLEERS